MHIPVKKFAMFPLNHIIVLKKADNLGVSILLWCIMVYIGVSILTWSEQKKRRIHDFFYFTVA